MITVDEALNIVLDSVEALGDETVALTEAHRRILAEDLFADLDLPPFDRARMDGYALRATDAAIAPVRLKVIGVSIDEAGLEAVKDFVTENKITYPIALDAEGRVANVLRTTVLPTSVMIGRDGRIVWRKVGAIMPNETTPLATLVEQTLGKL